MRQFGLIGYPLSHSFSKKYFTDKFIAEGTEAGFNNYSIETLDSLADIVKKDNLNGFAITIPHKRAILPLLHWQSAGVTEMNACNCVSVRENNWYGYNTDVIGFERSFLPLLKTYHTKALILGTGGAAAAVEFVLRKLKIFYKVVSRNKKEGLFSYEDLNTSVMEEYKVIINCSPVGTHPGIDKAPAIPYELITPQHYLYDLVYNPAQTMFLKKGADAGAATKNGYEMLVIQAEENWKIWNSI